MVIGNSIYRIKILMYYHNPVQPAFHLVSYCLPIRFKFFKIQIDHNLRAALKAHYIITEFIFVYYNILYMALFISTMVIFMYLNNSQIQLLNSALNTWNTAEWHLLFNHKTPTEEAFPAHPARTYKAVRMPVHIAP